MKKFYCLYKLQRLEVAAVEMLLLVARQFGIADCGELFDGWAVSACLPSVLQTRKERGWSDPDEWKTTNSNEEKDDPDQPCSSTSLVSSRAREEELWDLQKEAYWEAYNIPRNPTAALTVHIQPNESEKELENIEILAKFNAIVQPLRAEPKFAKSP